MKKLAYLTALAAAVAAVAVGPAAAMHGPGEGRQSTTVPQPPTQVIRVVRTSGFDWADAAIGAGSSAGAIGAAVGAALLARRRRPEMESAPSAATV